MGTCITIVVNHLHMYPLLLHKFIIEKKKIITIMIMNIDTQVGVMEK